MSRFRDKDNFYAGGLLFFWDCVGMAPPRPDPQKSLNIFHWFLGVLSRNFIGSVPVCPEVLILLIRDRVLRKSCPAFRIPSWTRKSGKKNRIKLFSSENFFGFDCGLLNMGLLPKFPKFGIRILFFFDRIFWFCHEINENITVRAEPSRAENKIHFFCFRHEMDLNITVKW